MKLIATNWKQGIGLFGFQDNRLITANIYNREQQICIGDIYVGRVNKILPNMNACFVQIGGKEEIFLPFVETDRPYKSGEAVLIQIKKEASKGKQPLGTTKLSLAGLYCVVNYEPHAIQISSKLEKEERNHWKCVLNQALESEKISSLDKEVLLKYCLIVRTNILKAKKEDEVISEWVSLAKRLDDIVKKGAFQSLYVRIYREESHYIRELKNISQDTLEEIITDDMTLYEEISSAFDNVSIMREKIRLYEDDFPLYKLYSIESKLQEALSKKIWLKCGGFLVIEPTEALTVIDVNSGKCDKKSVSEEYYKKVNEEAAVEIARQIVLRNISGIIIIDFINMQSKENQKELFEVLSRLVSKDKVKTRVMGMTSLGLVEMTRAKFEKPLWEQIKIEDI